MSGGTSTAHTCTNASTLERGDSKKVHEHEREHEHAEKHGEIARGNTLKGSLKYTTSTQKNKSRMQRKFDQVPPTTAKANTLPMPYIDTPFKPNKPGHLKRFGTVTRHSQPRSAGVRGIFEPLTSVDEPIVSRVQLQVFYLAAVWASVLAAVAGALAIVL